MRRLFILNAALLLSMASVAGAQDVPAECQQVLTALGKQGDYKANVLKVNIPRNDVTVRARRRQGPRPSRRAQLARDASMTPRVYAVRIA